MSYDVLDAAGNAAPTAHRDVVLRRVTLAEFEADVREQLAGFGAGTPGGLWDVSFGRGHTALLRGLCRRRDGRRRAARRGGRARARARRGRRRRRRRRGRRRRAAPRATTTTARPCLCSRPPRRAIGARFVIAVCRRVCVRDAATAAPASSPPSRRRRRRRRRWAARAARADTARADTRAGGYDAGVIAGGYGGGFPRAVRQRPPRRRPVPAGRTTRRRVLGWARCRRLRPAAASLARAGAGTAAARPTRARRTAFHITPSPPARQRRARRRSARASSARAAARASSGYGRPIRRGRWAWPGWGGWGGAALQILPARFGRAPSKPREQAPRRRH